ncbi:MAG: hypothetical protein Q8K93_01305 [Reyranella sp.]|uniref:hypothetical protein n=1 Tax=Reyranella sp. TaxID=1929291 RepID=UPI0027321B61|nr:hypothetical protein [Reyranella sp.]MDP1960814.1 hypothetical protein [Reyranella sp.]MDP2374073.1 hypothetical protein [Reyranella sp.]
MKGAPRTLHIRCGDDIRDKLVDAGVEGDYLSLADPAWLGPPPASNAWIAGRAALIAERTGLPRQKIRADLGDAYWRLARAPADYQRIVLWFEHDLYDQAALARVLAGFALRKKLPRLELIAIDRFRGIKRFVGLGQLSPGQLASLWPRRKPVGRRQIALGAKAWAALRAATPEPLEALCKSDLRALPFLKAALQRQLQELPWTGDGLSLTERNALAALARGARSVAEVYADAQTKRDPQPFMGDLFFWSVLRDLLEASRPPIAVSAATRRAAWHKRILRLTPVGKALLAGRLDWQTTGPLERWVGGIAVARGVSAWRWNPRTARSAQRQG